MKLKKTNAFEGVSKVAVCMYMNDGKEKGEMTSGSCKIGILDPI